MQIEFKHTRYIIYSIFHRKVFIHQPVVAGSQVSQSCFCCDGDDSFSCSHMLILSQTWLGIGREQPVVVHSSSGRRKILTCMYIVLAAAFSSHRILLVCSRKGGVYFLLLFWVTHQWVTQFSGHCDGERMRKLLLLLKTYWNACE